MGSAEGVGCAAEAGVDIVTSLHAVVVVLQAVLTPDWIAGPGLDRAGEGGGGESHHDCDDARGEHVC